MEKHVAPVRTSGVYVMATNVILLSFSQSNEESTLALVGVPTLEHLHPRTRGEEWTHLCTP
jgi:hypothetical protein